MLTEWTISNFKSIAKKTTLPLAPVTLICGANSSGKSTLIQSILLTAQTFGSPAIHRPLVLNGELVRLGYIDDVLHNLNYSDPIDIGFKLQSVHASRSSVDAVFRAIGGAKELSSSEIYLERSAIRTENSQIHIATMRNTIDKLSLAHPKKAWQLADDLRKEIIQGIFDYQIAKPEAPSDKSRDKDKPEYVSVAHFLPQRRLQEINIGEDKIRSWLTECANALRRQPVSQAIMEIDFAAEDGAQLKLSLRRIIEGSRKNKNLRSEMAIQDVAKADQSLTRSRNVGEWITIVRRDTTINTQRELARDIYFRAEDTKLDTGTGPLGARTEPFAPEVDKGVKEVIDFFTKRLSYLGPLRDDPRMIYSIPPIPDTKDVGAKGEYTAAVLERFGQDLIVECPMPDSDFVWPVRLETLPLSEALVLWLKHMGLVSGLSTADRGKMGVELTVSANALKRQLDLTNVGVGVSQVLPMLTMCFLAQRDSVVLMEQPELHLHPKVQAILGDFFLGMSARGVQCIIETHSERLINRIRRRIVEAEGASVMQQTRIYFTEKDGVATTFLPVEPNEYGAIQRWPRGFFDEGPNEASLIAKAATRKREAQTR